MTIQLPDDLVNGLTAIADAENVSVEKLTIEHLRALIGPTSSAHALLKRLQALPHPSDSAVDDLEAAIAAGRLSVTDGDLFTY